MRAAGRQRHRPAVGPDPRPDGHARRADDGGGGSCAAEPLRLHRARSGDPARRGAVVDARGVERERVRVVHALARQAVGQAELQVARSTRRAELPGDELVRARSAGCRPRPVRAAEGHVHASGSVRRRARSRADHADCKRASCRCEIWPRSVRRSAATPSTCSSPSSRIPIAPRAMRRS